MAALIPLLVALLLPAHAETIDRVVVVVEEQLVLASDIRFEAVLAGLDDSPSPFWDRTRSDPAERLVDAAVVRHLAADVSVYHPEEEVVRTRLEHIRSQFPDREAWQGFLRTWGLDEDALRTILRRRLVVERYLARNLQADPADRQVWLEACDRYLSEVRPRLRIRAVPARSEVGP